MILTRQKAIEFHRKMWNLVASETKRLNKIVREREVIGIMDLPEDLKHPFLDNFCCEYTERCSYSEYVCENCPIDWQRKKVGAYCFNSLYGQWMKAANRGDVKKAASLASHIANLPKRK